MPRWMRNSSGRLRADLGHGLELRITREGVERLPADAPKLNIYVFGQRLEQRAHDEVEAKRRAAHVARSWLNEAHLNLSKRGGKP